jgi:hypothetical protein
MTDRHFYAYESNNIADWSGDKPEGDAQVDWTDPTLARVTRLRLLTDPGCDFWDISYCYGMLLDGTPCRVRLPFYQIPRGKGKINAFLISEAKKAGLHAKRLGLLDNISCLW